MPSYKAEPFHRLLASKLDEVVEGKCKRLMVFAPPQHGKLMDHETPILTSGGWRRHGDLRQGDYVFGRDGNPVRVLAISEEGVADHEVEFTDGAILRCHGKHEWIVRDSSRSSSERYEPKHGRTRGFRPIEDAWETEVMASGHLWIGNRGRGGGARFQVDANVAVNCPERDLPLHPYVLGAWLGDGTATKNCITHAPGDSSIIDKVERIGIARTSICVHSTTGVHTSYFRQLYGILKRMGLKGKKQIPEGYLCASLKQRLELLAGLIDTDGSLYRHNGRVIVSTADPRLKEDIRKLIVSLGWRACVVKFEACTSSSGIVGKKPVFQIGFNPTLEIPTVLDRKANGRLTPTVRRRAIRAIRRCDPVPGRCIQVEGGIYLVGPTLVPTHNSQLVSVHLPSYWLMRWPDKPVILASYGAQLAHSKAREARNVVESSECQKLFPAIETDRESRAVDRWQIAGRRGYMLAAGVGGGITGHGAALAIVDDPVENWEQAQSVTYRERAWQWYRTTFRPRVWEGGAIVLIMSRWHEDDLAGRLLEMEGANWEVLRFPALAETQEVRDRRNARMGLPSGPDPLGRKPGEPLCPGRFSRETLESTRREIGSLAWAAEYDGCPEAPEGSTFKRAWYRTVERIPKGARFVRYWDRAGSETGTSWTCGTLMARAGNSYFVVDVVRGQWSEGEREKRIKATAELDRAIWGEVTIWVEQEPAHTGMESARATLRNLQGFAARADRVTGAKETRWQPFLAASERGDVHVLKGLWNGAWLDELAAQPGSRTKDQVDSTAGAFSKLSLPGGWVMGRAGA